MRTFLCIAAFATAIIIAPNALAQKSYTVAGDSMEPALMPGDTVVVDETAGGDVERGAMVAVMLGNRERPMVKRVAAVPGDRIEVVGGLLFVNGEKHEPVRRVDGRRWKSTLRQLENYGWVVPGGSVMLLGDNPENSRDSARLGLISIQQIKGKVVEIHNNINRSEGEK